MPSLVSYLATKRYVKTLEFVSSSASLSAVVGSAEELQKSFENCPSCLNIPPRTAELPCIRPINTRVSGMIIRARDILTRIAPELKDRLAQETDAHKCEQLVAGEVRRALNELAEFKPSN
jgi:hypothetical protein